MQYWMPRSLKPLLLKGARRTSKSNMTVSLFTRRSTVPISCISRIRALLCSYPEVCTTWLRKVCGMYRLRPMVHGRCRIIDRSRWTRSFPRHRFTTQSMFMFMTVHPAWFMSAIPPATPAAMSTATPFFTEPDGITVPGFHPITTIPVSVPGVLMSTTTRGAVGTLA